jgi:hypothetical protein
VRQNRRNGLSAAVLTSLINDLDTTGGEIALVLDESKPISTASAASSMPRIERKPFCGPNNSVS